MHGGANIIHVRYDFDYVRADVLDGLQPSVIPQSIAELNPVCVACPEIFELPGRYSLT